jgi:hypothetical protein
MTYILGGGEGGGGGGEEEEFISVHNFYGYTFPAL